MTISYIIPVWNRPEHLELVLECLQNQTHIPEQIIVIDDNSDNMMALKHENLCDKYGAEYHFHKYPGKQMRFTECQDIGLDFAINDITCFAHSDLIFDNSYCQKCSELVWQYENMALAHIFYYIASVEIVKQGQRDNKNLYEIANKKPDGTALTTLYGEQYQYSSSAKAFYISHYDYGPSYSNNPQPIKCGAIHWDSNYWMLTKNAKKVRWDRGIIGWGYIGDEFGIRCLCNGLSLVWIGDIIGYHVNHDKSSYIYSPRYIERTKKYLENKYKDRVISLSNPLKMKEK